MKIKTNIEFQPYKDGLCSICTVNEEGNKTYKYNNIPFDNRVLGFKRAYAARAVQADINRVIRIPGLTGIDNHDRLEILGDNYYFDIEMVQIIYDANPPSVDLTLRKVGIQE